MTPLIYMESNYSLSEEIKRTLWYLKGSQTISKFIKKMLLLKRRSLFIKAFYLYVYLYVYSLSRYATSCKDYSEFMSPLIYNELSSHLH